MILSMPRVKAMKNPMSCMSTVMRAHSARLWASPEPSGESNMLKVQGEPEHQTHVWESKGEIWCEAQALAQRRIRSTCGTHTGEEVEEAGGVCVCGVKSAAPKSEQNV